MHDLDWDFESWTVTRRSWNGGSFCFLLMYKENWEDTIFQKKYFYRRKMLYMRNMPMEDWFKIMEEFVRFNLVMKGKVSLGRLLKYNFDLGSLAWLTQNTFMKIQSLHSTNWSLRQSNMPWSVLTAPGNLGGLVLTLQVFLRQKRRQALYLVFYAYKHIKQANNKSFRRSLQIGEKIKIKIKGSSPCFWMPVPGCSSWPLDGNSFFPERLGNAELWSILLKLVFSSP